MGDDREHSYIPALKRELAECRIDRREFLRTATLLGMTAPAAYALAGALSGDASLIAPARAQGAMPKGGTIRIGMRCQDLKSPHTYSWVDSSNSGRLVYDYLTVTGIDNVTRPSLCAKWVAAADLGRRGARLAAQLPGVFQVLLAQPFGRAKDIVLRHVG